MATDPLLGSGETYSIVYATGDGVKTNWDLTFAGGYINKSHVKAFTEATPGDYVTRTFTWVGPNTIQITPPVANGVKLTIFRDTPKDEPTVDFSNGAIVNEVNLDAMAKQSVFSSAEVLDRFKDTRALSNATIATANTALAQSAAAVQTANAAGVTAGQAVTTANTANTTAGSANTTANTTASQFAQLRADVTAIVGSDFTTFSKYNVAGTFTLKQTFTQGPRIGDATNNVEIGPLGNAIITTGGVAGSLFSLDYRPSLALKADAAATTTSLGLKADKASPTFTGTVQGATLAFTGNVGSLANVTGANLQASSTVSASGGALMGNISTATFFTDTANTAIRPVTAAGGLYFQSTNGAANWLTLNAASGTFSGTVICTGVTTPTINSAAGVALQYNGSTKLATTTGGISVGGSVTATNGFFNTLTTAGQVVAQSSNTFFGMYNDGTNAYLMKSATTNYQYDTHRPFVINLSSGQVVIHNNAFNADGTLTTASHFTSGGNVTLQGNNVVYFSQWGGGWYMADATYLRSYSNKTIYSTGGFLGNGMAIDSGGQVGIGTGTPQRGLHLYDREFMAERSDASPNQRRFRRYWSASSGYINEAWDILNDAGNAVTKSLCSIYGSTGEFYWNANGNFNDVYIRSDRRYKTDYVPLANAAENVSAIPAYAGRKNGESSLYVMADEVEKVYPELVSENQDGYKSVNYLGLIPVLLAAVAELTARVQELEDR